MIIKAIEIRDKATFIPAIAIKMVPHVEPYRHVDEIYEAERYLLGRVGYGLNPASVVLCRMHCSGTERNATYDPYAWGTRTLHVAHQWLETHFDEIESGAVVDVEYLLGETTTPKKSERLDSCQ